MADIAINPVDRRVQFTGNTGTGPFAFTFNILADEDIVVYKNTTLLSLTTDYTVSTNVDGTGSVTMVAALIASDVLTIIGGRSLERTTDFVTAGDLLAASLNEQLDSLVIMAQQLDEKLSRSVKVNPGDVFTDLELPNKSARKGTVLAFNESSGDPEPGPTIDDVGTVAAIVADIAALADIEDGTVATDAISDLAAIDSDVTTVAGITSDVTTVAGISSDVTAVVADEADIGTVASNIADVNTVAGISADVSTVAADGTDIGTVAGISADVSTVAGDSADVTAVAADLNGSDTIGTVAGSISNVNLVGSDIDNVNATATNLSSINTFLETYRIGTVDPTTSLDEGDLFYNTTTNQMKVYNGSAWTVGVLSGSGTLLSANNLSDLDDKEEAQSNIGWYHSKTVSVDTTLASGAEVITGTNLTINDGVTLTIPNNSRLELRNFIRGEVL